MANFFHKVTSLQGVFARPWASVGARGRVRGRPWASVGVRGRPRASVGVLKVRVRIRRCVHASLRCVYAFVGACTHS